MYVWCQIFIWQQFNIGLGNDSSPDKREAITCSNNDPVYRHIKSYM